MLLVGYVFHRVAHLFPHGIRKRYAEILFQNIIDAALAGLAVYADHIGIVRPSHILRIHREIGNAPDPEIFVLTPLHSLGDGILVGTREGREHQVSGIWLAGIHMHPGTGLVFFTDFRHPGKVKQRIHPVGKHIHGQGYDVHIAGALPVAE